MENKFILSHYNIIHYMIASNNIKLLEKIEYLINDKKKWKEKLEENKI